jgi:hypothetical protein
MAAARPGNGAGSVFSLLVVGAIVLVLLILAGYGLIIRSQWRCLRNAPEQCGAKWWMFAAVLCIVAGPAMGTTASLVGLETPTKPIRLRDQAGVPLKGRELWAEVKKANAPALPMKIASAVITFLSQVFFVMFLRSVGLSFNDVFRARIAELYLVLGSVLFTGTVWLTVAPETILADRKLLLFLAACWAISGIWYHVLIVSTCACIHRNLAILRSPHR